MRQFLSKSIKSLGIHWYIPSKVSRVEIIQHTLDYLGAKRYLEIGVSQGECFCSLRVPEKFGIDPIDPAPNVVKELMKPGVSYFQMESDKFFQSAKSRGLRDGLDVVFIDGLHTYEQAYRDFENSLKYLNPYGIILLHDCLPRSSAEAQPADSFDQASKINGPLWNGAWTGDVWKVIVRLRSERNDISAEVLNCDHGIGLVSRSSCNAKLPYSLSEISSMTFKDLSANPQLMIGLHKPIHLFSVLRQLSPTRQK